MFEVPITEEQFKENWEFIKNQMYENENPNLLTRLERDDIMLFKKNHGKTKLKKYYDNKIMVGDKVSKYGMIGEVIDTNDNLVCVRNKNGDIEIWNVKDIKKVR